MPTPPKPNNRIDDGNFAFAQAISPPRFTQPFQGDNGEYILEQDFDIDAKYFAPLALNTLNPDYAQYMLVSEGQTSPVGLGLVKWTRRYAKKPVTRNDPSSITYRFIGYLGFYLTNPVGTPTGNIIGRLPFTRTVNCRIQNDYFLIDPTNTAADYTSILAVPVNYALTYYVPRGYWSGSTFIPDPIVGFNSGGDFSGATLTAQQVANLGIAQQAIWDTTGHLALSITPASVPSTLTYQGWVNSKTEIVAEDSTLQRWEGNIFVRQTKYIVAL